MKEKRFIKFTYIHDIATIVSVILSAFFMVKGTGSKVKDAVLGSFFVMQVFGLFKIISRFVQKTDDLNKSLEVLYDRLEKEWGDGWRPLMLISFVNLFSVFFKIGIPFLLGKDDFRKSPPCIGRSAVKSCL